ncbi:hypothetical protein M3Y98_00531600 [Aphelenchoides besseyi]|nr:hypothetical protein M3Y98_00531600 [Aphelenchoides besseyi]KAI6208051.1 hypothetical protein M3Y96_00073700 [Aphelenchoides besseyi]
MLIVAYTTAQRWHFPPPKVLLAHHQDCVSDVQEDPRKNCHNGTFSVSMGYYIPCRAHKHCYGAREPPNWCLSVANYNWTNWGCHCDPKIGSCIVERFQELGKHLEWAYCIPNEEFYCAASAPTFQTTDTRTTPTTTSTSTISHPIIQVFSSRTTTSRPRTTIDNLITSLDRRR